MDDDLHAVHDAIKLCAQRWTLEILTALGQRPMRFSELLREIHPAPSSKSLNDALRRLRDSGLVHHTDGDSAGTYSLTAAGTHLLPLLSSFMREMRRWSDTYRDGYAQPTGADAGAA
ncbi:transcriptional regulator [Micromonospora aurantiaca]|uniref:winged helix-turn-helix transcriptional regulator n=1 Tax=Micromonospora aurantiaca (nom. illeg.) TaxID=47850 RepID=UPI000F408965|nr:helix-turn-helix domain-containing protein [Micromonospora aurantiaca]RNH94182.1 transcriptional regulator [Micromonospora aurantiaca]